MQIHVIDQYTCTCNTTIQVHVQLLNIHIQYVGKILYILRFLLL